MRGRSPWRERPRSYLPLSKFIMYKFDVQLPFSRWLLGAMVATPTGRSIGNQIGDAAINKLKDVVQTPASGKEDDDGQSA